MSPEFFGKYQVSAKKAAEVCSVSGFDRSQNSAVAATPADSASLPDIDDRPAADLVIYDGQCNFCRAQVRRLDWLAGGRLAFLSLHDDRVPVRFPDLSREELMAQMYVIATNGRRYAGAAGVRYLSRRLPRLWPLAPLLHIPFSLPFWQMLYRVVARYRYRLAGKSMDCGDNGCRIHME